MATQFSIENQNFDQYFERELVNLTPEAKDGLPKDVLFKLFRKGGAFNSTSTSRLGFLAKLYILCRCLKKRWYLVVEDEELGLKVDQFDDIPRLIKEREYGAENAEELVTRGGFIYASKELCDTFHFLNRLSTGPAYNYLTRVKNMPANPVNEADKKDQYVVQALMTYESTKKAIVAQIGLNMPELYVLMFLYPGDEVLGSVLYKDKLKMAYQSSPAKIKLAFGSLQAKGYIRKFGQNTGARLQITPAGKDMIRSIMHKYWLNW